MLVCKVICVFFRFFVFFKQKTAYELRISDWSSDVCSSDLQLSLVQRLEGTGANLLAEKMVGRHHHVVAATAGQQLAFKGFVGIEDIVDGLDARDRKSVV